MRKNKMIALSLITMFFMVNLTYGQETLSEKGGTEAKRPVIWASKINNTSLLNLYKVDSAIFRCEQPDEKGFQELTDMGVKSILNLRNKHTDSIFLQNSPLNYFKVNMEAKDISDDEMIEALKILKNAPKPIVVHCKHGADRTGAVVAMYRIVFQNWTKEKAIAELKYGGFGFHAQLENIPLYLQKVNIVEIKKMVLEN